MDNIIAILKNLFLYDPQKPIEFTGGYFLFLFSFFVLIYSTIQKNTTWKKWSLIIFSFFIYYKLTGLLCLLILIPTVADFLLARQMAKTESESQKKWFLYTALLFSLGLLIYFKYTNFFIEIINGISGKSFQLLELVKVLGISYFVFRSISYILDVYHEKIDPTEKFSDYLLYMTFFPLIISGPITRAESFLPQIEEKNTINKEQINQGIYLIFKGMIKKAIFADYLFLYVKSTFFPPDGYTGLENLVGIVCFTVHIYLNFSGYTDMVRGMAKILGFEIGINFDEPFKAKSITEFWRRWHISLSEWLKDYLYFPLNYYFRRLKIYGAIVALFITFFICGIWHGTTYSFVLFGALHGIALSWEFYLKNHLVKKVPSFNKISDKLQWFLTFTFICLTFMSMYIDIDANTPITISKAGGIIVKIFTEFDLSFIVLYFTEQYVFTAMFTLALILIFLNTKNKDQFRSWFESAPLYVKTILFIILVQLIVEMQSQNYVPFIYAKYG